MADYTSIDDPSAHFQGTEYTGSGADRSVTNAGNSDLQPDLVWIKTDSASSQMWQDSSRGVTKYLRSNLSSAEATASSVIQAFQTDGFSLSAGGGNNVSGEVSMSWQWKAGGGSTSTNDTGDITSTLQTNSTGGFTIGTYTGNSTDNQTIAHGLGATPGLIIVKRLSGTANWAVWHKCNTFNHILRLNMDATESDSASGRVGAFGSQGSSTIFTVFQGSSAYGNTNESGESYVFYAWKEVQGFSKFGKYKGNGNANGSFNYTGFKPAVIILKNYANAGYNWWIADNQRSTFNEVDQFYFPNLNNEEFSGSGAGIDVDFLSNGFKLRTDNTGINGNGHSYMYMAWAENPFVTSTSANSIPTTAR
jgi:hypothetical protein